MTQPTWQSNQKKNRASYVVSSKGPTKRPAFNNVFLGVKLFQRPNKQIPPIRRLVQPGKRRKKHFSGARLRVTNLGSVKIKCNTNQQNNSSYMGDATRGKCWMEISKMVGIRPTILDSTQQKLRIWCEYETTLVQANINGDNLPVSMTVLTLFLVFSLSTPPTVRPPLRWMVFSNDEDGPTKKGPRAYVNLLL